MSKYPNVIIGGAPKCGTSSLFFWLAAHPQVCASKLKETYFLAHEVNRFNRELNVHEHGLEAYQQHFSHCSGQAIRLEATPVYIYYRETIELVKQLPETPKMIFILRNPADRIYSHWRFNRYRMKNIKLSFEEYVKPENIPAHWKKNYLDNSRYIDYLKHWLEAFGKENVLVYQFEKLTADREGFMKKLAEDLGLEPTFYDDFNFFHRNETVAIGSKKLHRWGLKLEPYVPQIIQEKIIPWYLKLNAKKAPVITEREKEVKKELARSFRNANEDLATTFANIDLALW